MCQTIIDPCEVLAKALQAVNVTATGAVRASNVLLVHLRKLLDEDEFDHLYRQAEIDAASLGFRSLPTETDLSCRRQARPPSRYEMQTNTSRPHNFIEKKKLRSEYYAALAASTSQLCHEWQYLRACCQMGMSAKKHRKFLRFITTLTPTN